MFVALAFILFFYKPARPAQLVRRPTLRSGGRRFEPGLGLELGEGEVH